MNKPEIKTKSKLKYGGLIILISVLIPAVVVALRVAPVIVVVVRLLHQRGTHSYGCVESRGRTKNKKQRAVEPQPPQQ